MSSILDDNVPLDVRLAGRLRPIVERAAPLARSFPDGWLIGKPHTVFEFDRPVRRRYARR
jgi:hypothetical protein